MLANGVDPDQTDPTAPSGAVWSGSILFAQTSLSVMVTTVKFLKYSDNQNFGCN